MTSWILGGVLLAFQGSGETIEKYTDCQFTLPRGYVAVDLGRGTSSRRSVRTITEPGPAQLELGIHIAAYGALDPAATLQPHDVARILDLPASARITVFREAWRTFQVPAAEYRFDWVGRPQLGMCVFLPIEGKLFVLEIKGPEPLEGEARVDLRKVAASATGDSHWARGSGSGRIPTIFLVLGSLFILVGLFWSANSVYKSGERAMGCLFLLFAPAAVIYGLIHFDELRKPCLVQIVGYFFFLLALAASKYGF